MAFSLFLKKYYHQSKVSFQEPFKATGPLVSITLVKPDDVIYKSAYPKSVT